MRTGAWRWAQRRHERSGSHPPRTVREPRAWIIAEVIRALGVARNRSVLVDLAHDASIGEQVPGEGEYAGRALSAQRAGLPSCGRRRRSRQPSIGQKREEALKGLEECAH